ncbi:hypothetical protein MKW98_032032 [Papaver atlanticum]|uniref:Uncharacterized protein n=1 Tax=Papaver atlanticum TaxID=357466 RepID=A0AAD4XE34_9MAGN|nr:hypothetical protein MKW98_032032 [Papaver atlanticum]
MVGCCFGKKVRHPQDCKLIMDKDGRFDSDFHKQTVELNQVMGEDKWAEEVREDAQSKSWAAVFQEPLRRPTSCK